jgi:hypothetical protein
MRRCLLLTVKYDTLHWSTPLRLLDVLAVFRLDPIFLPGELAPENCDRGGNDGARYGTRPGHVSLFLPTTHKTMSFLEACYCMHDIQGLCF